MSIMTRYIANPNSVDLSVSEKLPTKGELKRILTNLGFAIKLRNRMITQTLLGLAVAALVVFGGSASTAHNSTTSELANVSSTESTTLDEVSSANIAAAIAVSTDSLVAREVIELAETLDAEVTLGTDSGSSILAKPAIVGTDEKTLADNTTYTVQSGDTLASISDDFGVSADTIKWANNLDTNTVEKGDKLKIPAINGVLYKVKSGDTPESLAKKYKSNAHNIIAFNDAEINGLKVGKTILIPDGEKPAPVVQAVAASGGNYSGGLRGTSSFCGSKKAQTIKRVSAGETIGVMGTTGSSTGTHIHFGVCPSVGSNTVNAVAGYCTSSANCNFVYGLRSPTKTPHRMSSPFGPRWGRIHAGTDFDWSGSSNREIVAAASGDIIGCGYMGAAGNAIIIRHDSGVVTHYFHMSALYC